MTRVTIALDNRSAAWVRRQAAGRNMNVSGYTNELLREKMVHSRKYEEAMRQALAQKPLRSKGLT